MKIYDYIIVGGGVAGLYSALNIPKELEVLIIVKDFPWESNSFYAQGGISVAKDREDISSHIEDTVSAGAGTGNLENIEIMVSDGIEVINELIEMGLKFDVDSNGNLLFTKEGAHSTNRILHLGGDATGRYMHSFMLSKVSHEVWHSTVVTDILAYDSICYGVTVCRDGNSENLYARNTILASGGVGDIYKYHTNGRSISGEIQGIAIEKGISLKSMEMLQFHPTVVISGDESSLVSEAVRGEGATIIDEDGEQFVDSLLPRDIVSRAILKHKKRAFLDISRFEEKWFWNRFPTIAKFLDGKGFKLTKEPIPISPAFHYAIGGIETDRDGKVAGFHNLYAVGEVAFTGVHGANRLASNSLLEALVFAKRGAVKSLTESRNFQFREFPLLNREWQKEGDEVLKRELQNLMWRYASIERSGVGIEKAKNRVEEMLSLDIGRSLKLQLFTANQILISALQNRSSIGVHYRIDV